MGFGVHPVTSGEDHPAARPRPRRTRPGSQASPRHDHIPRALLDEFDGGVLAIDQLLHGVVCEEGDDKYGCCERHAERDAPIEILMGK